MRLSILSILAASAGALGAYLPIEAHPPQIPSSVFYFLVNNKTAGRIVAVDSNSNSSNAVITLSGGKGDSVRTLEDRSVDVPRDSIESAFAIIVDRNLLFVVSAGSDQLSLFEIDPRDPLHPKLVRQPVASGGDFPVSVAYSRELNKACVLNAGVKNGVQCYDVDLHRGLTPDGPFRPLGRTNQTTPPVIFTGACAISFNGDNSMLLITQKNAPIVIYPVRDGRIAHHGVASNVLPVAYGTSWVSRDTLFVADISFGGSLLSIDERYVAKEVKHTDNTQLFGFACWAQYVPRINKVILAPANTTRLGIYDATTGTFDGLASFDLEPRGAYDMVLDSRDGRTVWFLMRSDFIGSYDAVTDKPGKMISVNSTLVGDRQYWQGLAQWTPATSYY